MAFITALIVLFFHACTWEGMVFEFVSSLGKKNKAKNPVYKPLPEYLRKPLYDCPICMTMWWGPVVIAGGVLAGFWVISNSWQLFWTCFLAAGINIFLTYSISHLKNIVKEEKEEPCNC